MKRRVLIIDTSILVVWLGIPGFSDAGSQHWTMKDIIKKFEKEERAGARFVLTIATIIETGNHIAHIKDRDERRNKVIAFAELIEVAVSEKKSWMVYYSEHEMWSKEGLLMLADSWRSNGIYKLSMGDASILSVANALKGLFDVELYTGDNQLYELSMKPVEPRYAPMQKRN